jgi:predicted RNase H-like nuclease
VYWAFHVSVGMTQMMDFRLGLSRASENVRKTGHHVVEVYPAMALWRWCSGSHHGTWQYKKDRECRASLAGLMSNRMGKDLRVADEDALDAWISWYLARCWLDRCGVVLLGSARTGSFLLPEQPDLQERFADEYGRGARS